MGRARRQGGGEGARLAGRIPDHALVRRCLPRQAMPDVVKQLRRRLPAQRREGLCARPAGCSAAPTCAPRCRAEDADGGRGRRGGLRDAGRDGGGAASRHRRLDLTVLPKARHLTPLERPRRHRSRARAPAGAVPRNEIHRRADREGAARGRVRDAARRALLRLVRRWRARPCRDRAGPLCGGVRDQGRLHEIQLQGDGRGDARRSAERDRGQGRGHAARHRRPHDRDLADDADRGRRRDQDRLRGRRRADRQARQPRPAGAALEGEGDGEAVRGAAARGVRAGAGAT